MNAKANKTQELMTDIQNQIISGRLKPLDKLMPLRDLAKEYQASRSVINSAIHVLSAKGYVTIRPRQGVIVNAILETGTTDLIKDIYFSDNAKLKSQIVKDVLSTRMMAEIEAIRQIFHKEKVDYTNLDLIISKEAVWLERKEQALEELCELDHLFHQELVSLSGNKVLKLLYISFQDIEKSLIQMFYENLELPNKVINSHLSLVRALKTKNQDLAEKIWIDLLEEGERETLNRLRT